MENTLSQELIDKYLSGDLSNEEAHKVEMMMLESDFDQDAMDGFEETYPTGGISDDLSKLEKKIDDKTQERKKASPFWYKIAAAVAILAISTVFVLNIDFNSLDNSKLTEQSTPTDKIPAPSAPLPKKEIQDDITQNTNTDSTIHSNAITNEIALADTKEEEIASEPILKSIEEVPSNTFANEEVEDVEYELDEEVFTFRDITTEDQSNTLKMSTGTLGNSATQSILPPKKIEGVIRSNNGEELAGVIVKVKGTDIGVATDINGYFDLDLPNTHDTLVISQIGLNTQEIAVRTIDKLEIEMQEDLNALSEVVITKAEKPVTSRMDLTDAEEKRDRAFNYKQAEVVEQESRRSKKRRKRSTFSGTRLITGKVLSTEDSTIIPGVNILVEGTNTYAKTDKQGNFEVKIPDDPETTLALAFIGLENNHVEVGEQTDLQVYLAPDTTKQSDIVVVDYEANREALPELLMNRARPAGGKEELEAYIARNRDGGTGGSESGGVIIEFTILPNGELTEFNVVKGMDTLHDQEAERLIREGPKWLPASTNGKPKKDKVRVRIKLNK